MKKAAVFLDRDGTIIKDNGYINNTKQIEFYSYSFESLRTLQAHFELFIITNQAGIGKGLITKLELEKIHNFMLRALNDEGIKIREVYTCPHTKQDNCICRKPKPYFIAQAIQKYNIDIIKSYIIGDHPSDVELAINTGANGIYVLSGHGLKHYTEIEQIKSQISIKRNLQAACKEILRRKNCEI